MEELLIILSAIYPMSEGLTNYLRSNLEAVELKKKNFLLKSGRVSDHIYFVQKGLLRCYHVEGGKETCTWFMDEGNVIVSVGSFFTRSPSREPIQALEDCALLGISYSQLQFAYREFMEFNFIARVLTERYYVLSEKRAVALRWMKAREHYEYLIQTQPGIVGRVESRFIASYLGIEEETLSRIKRNLNS